MSFVSKKFLRAATASALIGLFPVPQSILAQTADHVVNPTQMQQSVVDAAQARQQNVDTLTRFFSSDKAAQALRASHIDPQQVKSAIPNLNDQELAQLAQRANNAQRDFAAGATNDHDLLLILVVVAVLILIIVAVHS